MPLQVDSRYTMQVPGYMTLKIFQYLPVSDCACMQSDAKSDDQTDPECTASDIDDKGRSALTPRVWR